eukprot:gene17835-biopygen8362
MHCAPGLAGVVWIQRVVIWLPKTGIQVRWHPIRVGYGTLVAPPESRGFRRWVFMPAGPPRTPSPRPGPA